MSTLIGITSVNVGQPRVLRRLRKGPVYSSIAKQPTVAEVLEEKRKKNNPTSVEVTRS